MNDLAYDVADSGNGVRQIQLTLTLVLSMSSGVGHHASYPIT